MILMTNTGGELPSGWTEQRDETQHEPTAVEYRHETTDDTIFIISVRPDAANEGRFELRLSTIDPTSTHVRHDYPIDDYDALEAAIDEAESFVDVLSERLRKGTISSADPDIGAIREMIREFTDDRRRFSVRRLFQRFR